MTEYKSLPEPDHDYLEVELTWASCYKIWISSIVIMVVATICGAVLMGIFAASL